MVTEPRPAEQRRGPGPVTILAAVDDSRDAHQVAEAARWLAQALDGTVVVAHAFDPMDVPMPPARDLAVESLSADDVVTTERLRMHGVLADARIVLEGVPHETQLVEGVAVPALTRLAVERDVDVIVVGPASRGMAHQVLEGSVAAQLIAKAPCPVVVVGQDAALDEPGPVVAAYDGSEHSLRGARYAAALAAALGRDLEMVDVVEPGGEGATATPELALELHAAVRAHHGPRPPRTNVHIQSIEGDPVRELARFAGEQRAVLVVSGSRGRGALRSALLGSVSAGLIGSAGRPVVVVGPHVRPA